mmetsp:Transcript_10542/g.34942  ORF Transcript_10542/g.34942 Transcript_10542/m.34942 type:complete len:391 (+) Transcript_10542:949-2121(+)
MPGGGTDVGSVELDDVAGLKGAASRRLWKVLRLRSKAVRVKGDWQLLQTKDRRKLFYYWNSFTGETRWADAEDDPPDDYGGSASPQPFAPQPNPSGDECPWGPVVDENDALAYYYNYATGEWAYDKPAALRIDEDARSRDAAALLQQQAALMADLARQLQALEAGMQATAAAKTLDGAAALDKMEALLEAKLAALAEAQARAANEPKQAASAPEQAAAAVAAPEQALATAPELAAAVAAPEQASVAVPEQASVTAPELAASVTVPERASVPAPELAASVAAPELATSVTAPTRALSVAALERPAAAAPQLSATMSAKGFLDLEAEAAQARAAQAEIKRLRKKHALVQRLEQRNRGQRLSAGPGRIMPGMPPAHPPGMPPAHPPVQSAGAG